MIVPERPDKQYRAWKDVPQPQAVAAIVYMMDVSGSMTDEQKEIVRIESFWIDTWIKAHYQGVETAYIIHDAIAQEVNEQHAWFDVGDDLLRRLALERLLARAPRRQPTPRRPSTLPAPRQSLCPFGTR